MHLGPERHCHLQADTSLVIVTRAGETLDEQLAKLGELIELVRAVNAEAGEI